MKHWTRYMPTKSGEHLTGRVDQYGKPEKVFHHGLAAIAARASDLSGAARKELERRGKKRRRRV